MSKRSHISLEGGTDVKDLTEIANIAEAGDNCAIATGLLNAGTEFVFDGKTARISHTILEGHRFALMPINKGEYLMSWGLPFGIAERDLLVGEYVMNSLMINALQGRREVTWELPAVNFKDTDTSVDAAFSLDEEKFTPGKQVELSPDHLDHTWNGFMRPHNRGVGTRNCVLIIGATVNSSGFVRTAEQRASTKFSNSKTDDATVDRICAFSHNEGGAGKQNNRHLILSVLKGVFLHCNTAAAIVVFDETEPQITESDFRELLGDRINHVPHRIVTRTSDWASDLKTVVDSAVELANTDDTKRTPQSFSHLKIALQCGGSDAFSGVTGNPLVGIICEKLIKLGGCAVIAETPELVGAEPYILDNCEDLSVAKHFLNLTTRYMEYAGRHGQNASGNPSGGNLFRGLYNIVLKSLGASRKKSPTTCLTGCLDYGESIESRLGNGRGYFFMDSPGNDLESIAGQVASGCNLIFFVTGNGAITNFPSVPTLKFVTTTGRYSILSNDMDVNAGELNDGVPRDVMSAKVLAQAVSISEGSPCKGELSGHYQVSIWRNWANEEGKKLEDLEKTPNYMQDLISASSLEITKGNVESVEWINNVADDMRRVRLVLPTSLCSSQIAGMAATRLNESNPEYHYHFIPHTEGCGGGGGVQFDRFMSRILTGHIRHPYVCNAYVMEHGCEKTHNDWFLSQIGRDAEHLYGWGSVQQDGGVERICNKVSDYFSDLKEHERPKSSSFSMGLLVKDVPTDTEALQLANVCKMIIGNGGSVVTTKGSKLLESAAFISSLLIDDQPSASLPCTLAYAEVLKDNCKGFHIMDCQSVMSYSEQLTGLVSTGCHLLLWWVGSKTTSLQLGHPFIPTVHISSSDLSGGVVGKPPGLGTYADFHVDTSTSPRPLINYLHDVLVGKSTTISEASGHVDFSIPRGQTAISL